MSLDNINPQSINTEAQYINALKRVFAIFQSATGSPEAEKLDLLLSLIKNYEDRHIILPQMSSGKMIKLEK